MIFQSLPDNVINVCLFGSMAREDNDELSDADILVVVEDRSGKIPEQVVSDFVVPHIGTMPTISWYGRERLQTMFHDGHLFAWHLFQEAKTLYGDEEIKNIFGEPGPYQDAMVDITSFAHVMSGIPNALSRCPSNAVYEMGLLYVCVRNIAMSASWHLCQSPDFTRYSPFNAIMRTPGVSRVDYELTMACRMASQRGLEPPAQATTAKAMFLHKAFERWAQNIIKDVDDYVGQSSSKT